MTNSSPFAAERQLVSSERLVRRDAPALEFLVCRPAGPATGTPVLFLHGAFAGAWCWQESWLPRMAEAGRLGAAVSLRGHGSSEGRDGLRFVSLADFRDDLILAIRAMPSPPIVVAHSLGALLAQQILGRVVTGAVAIRGLVLVGSLPPEGLALMAPWLTLTTWLAVVSGTMDLRRASSFTDPHRRSGDGTWHATVAAASAAYGGDVAATSLVQALIPQLVTPAWLARVPTLALHGADDSLIDRVTALRTAAYHNADFVRVPGAGHYPMLGRHAVAGADALLGWMQGQGL